MAGFKPTNAQKKAINTQNKNILVSASAGSGKTAVLVNRVVNLIKRDKSKSIDRMLLVTFTDAAAKNMRDKIRQEMQKIAQDHRCPKEERDRMRDQANRLAAADISTIHAFCLRLVKRYYYLIDLDPQMRLLTDETERLLLREDVWHEVSETYYAKANQNEDEPFSQLVANFSSDRDDQGLDDLVLELDDVASAQPDPEKWLRQLPQSYALGEDILQSHFYRQGLVPIITERLQQLQQDLQENIVRAEQSGLDKDRTALLKIDQTIRQLLGYLTGKASLVKDALKQTRLEEFSGRASKNFKAQCQTIIEKWESFVKDTLDSKQSIDPAVVQEKVNQTKAAFHDLQAAAPTKKAQDYLKGNELQLAGILEFLAPRSWNSIRALFQETAFASIPRKPKDNSDTESHEAIKNVRAAIVKAVKEINNHFFAYDEQTLRRISRQAQQILQELSKATVSFRQRYQQTKRSRRIMEFSDLEHYALEILTPPADQPDWQELVADLRKHYQAIMIDEYQDTNPLQESILMRLADEKSHKLFMVGDVKQSIYRFREADPSLFLNKYQRYRQPQDDSQAIVLGENFRSMKGVTEFTNLVFKQIMDKTVGEIAYDQDAELKYAAKYYDDNPANKVKPTEVLLYVANDGGQPADSHDDSADHHEQDNNYEDDKLAGELRMVGAKIKQLVESGYQIYHNDDQQMHPVQYGDIVLLERTKGINNTLVEEFSKLGVPLTVHDVESYFQTIEVRVMMSLLRVIDNPHQDIPFVAVLRSPIVGLTNQELAFIRLQNKSADYYTAFCTYLYNYENHKPLQYHEQNLLLKEKGEGSQADREKQLYDKLDRFACQLSRFRNTARQQTLVDLIWQIYNDTGYLDYVGTMRGGQQRQANLHALYQRAQSYEESSFKGLYQFIRFIEKMQEHDKDLGIAPTQLTANTVNVMTIHGSKGLQFPIVFLVDATHGFNQQASRGSAVVDANAGIGIKVLDRQQMVRYDTPQQRVALEQIKRSERAEDMRILYVALTRAEQQLFITGSYNEAQRRHRLESAWQQWQKAYQNNATVLSSQLRITAGSFMDWIGLALTRYANDDNKFTSADLKIGGLQLTDSPLAKKASAGSHGFEVAVYDARRVDELLASEPVEPLQDNAMDHPQAQEAGAEKIVQQLKYQYPNTTATHTTAYQSVTDVKRIFEDDDSRMARTNYGEDADTASPNSVTGGTEEPQIFIDPDFAVPDFIQQTEEETQPRATQIGTATHLVFQKLPLKSGKIELGDVENELARLVDEQLIGPLVAQQVDCRGIAGFFHTPVGQKILDQPEDYHREEPFAMIMNGHEPFKAIKAEDNDQVLIHGIIDGYLETENGIILVDYKTDHVAANDQAVQKVVRRYSGQLRLYAEALNIMKNIPVVQMGLYLVELNEFVSICSRGENNIGDH